MAPDESSWKWWNERLGAPQHVLSPMVDQSELAFRLLCREIYNTRYASNQQNTRPGLLCYTPMLHAEVFVKDQTYRTQRFSTCDIERNDAGGLIAQFCGNSADTLVEAGRIIQNQVDAVDLNLGCPENIAMRGHYGSFLLRETDLLTDIVSKWSSQLDVPCTCKIRLLDERSPDQSLRGLQGTINLCKRLEAAGASAICVHARTRHEKGIKTSSASWESIKRIKEVLEIPVIANGGIETFEDIKSCFDYTGADAVMSAEAVLEYPALFNGPRSISDYADFGRAVTTCKKYLALVSAYPPPNFNQTVKAHCLKFLYAALKILDDVNEKGKVLKSTVMNSSNFSELKSSIDELDIYFTSVHFELEKTDYKASSWYRRHRRLLSKGQEALKNERRLYLRAMGYKV